ncbi:RRP12-like protein [Linum perenne]
MASPAPEKPIRHKRRFGKMKPQPKRQRTEANPADPEEHEPDNRFNDETDLCKQLMSRYSTSTAPQHQHLLATAAAFQSILSSESRPLTPTSYFLAAMDNLSDSEALDSTAVTALSSFVSIVTPLIPEKGVASDKATESVAVLVGAVLGRDGLGVSTLSGVVKCLGVLIAKFCDLKNWKSVKLGFGSLLELSVDKRPKLRRAAQDSLVDVLKSFKSSPAVIKEASKLVLSLLKSHAPSDTETVDPSKVETASDTKHVELLHVLNLLKITVPHLSDKISSKILAEIVKLMTSNFLPQTRHVFQIIEVFLTSSGDDVIGPYIEVIADTLASYVLLGEKNPVDTIISAAMLFKVVLDKLQARGSCSWMKTFSKFLGSLEGLLSSEAGTASQATDIIKELIHRGLDVKVLGSNKRQSLEGAGEGSQEADIIKETCLVFENALNSCSEVPREQILSVIAVLFRNLGEFSFIFMKGVVPKLADLMNHANLDSPETIHLKSCIGSAVVALGPEKILGLIPISFNADSLTCSNNWLVPILNDHIVGASLECYVDHVVPLAKSLQRASHKVKKTVLRQELQAIAQGLLELLPAFCNYPVDTHSRFESMAAILIAFLKKDPTMHKTIAISLKVLVSQNRIALGLGCNAVELNSNENKDLVSESTSLAPYSVKTANRNIKALASHSSDLLQTLIDMLIASPPEKRLHLKEAIGCLASITKSSITKKIFSSRLEKLKLVNTSGEFEKPTSQSDELATEEQSNQTELENTERRVIMELASCLVEGASEDLIQLMYNFITYLLEETKISGHGEAYCTLSKILEHHHWFCSSRSIEVFELLINLKAPVDIQSLKYRFSCFHFLLVHTLEDKAEEDNARTFLILNEIVLTLKDVSSSKTY